MDLGLIRQGSMDLRIRNPLDMATRERHIMPDTVKEDLRTNHREAQAQAGATHTAIRPVDSGSPIIPALGGSGILATTKVIPVEIASPGRWVVGESAPTALTMSSR